MGGKEQTYVDEAFKTNWIAPLGPHVNNFETDLCDYTGASYAAALSSGTAALHLALIMLDLKPGDYVICQGMTFSASANPIVYQDAIPIFVDSEPETWNMNPEHLERAIKSCIEGNPNTQNAKLPKAIIPVHLYGMPSKMDEITAIANKYGIPVIEDAAESLGSSYLGKHTGIAGKMGILSFNGNKIITTSGGGALISDDEALISKSRFLATQARDPAVHYQHSEIGYNYRMSNVLAGIGRGQMEVLPERIKQRRANFNRYKIWFEKWNVAGFDIRFQEEDSEMFSNRWLTAILVDPAKNNGLTSEIIRLALDEENIEARPLWKPMHLQPVFEEYPFFGDGTSERLFDHGLCLPSGSNLTDEDFARIFEVLGAVLKDFSK